MNKSSIKKIIMFVVIALVAVTGFAGVASNFKLDNGDSVFASQITDLGLEYKDGSYLIKTEEDYYTMQQRIGDGTGDDVNYKLMNNIEISSTKAQALSQGTVFSGIMDGNCFKVTVRDDTGIMQESDVKAGALTGSNTGTTTSGSTITDYTRSNGNANLDQNGGWDSKRMKVRGIYCGILKNATFTNWDIEVSGGTTTIAPSGDWKTNADDTDDYIVRPYDISFAFGGLAGAAYNSTISYVRLTYKSKFTLNITPTTDGDWNGNVYFGGLVGVLDNSSIEYCIIRDLNAHISINNYKIGNGAAKDVAYSTVAGLYIGSASAEQVAKVNSSVTCGWSFSASGQVVTDKTVIECAGGVRPAGGESIVSVSGPSKIWTKGGHPSPTGDSYPLKHVSNGILTWDWVKCSEVNGGEITFNKFVYVVYINGDCNTAVNNGYWGTSKYSGNADILNAAGWYGDGGNYTIYGEYDDYVPLPTRGNSLTWTGYTYKGITISDTAGEGSYGSSAFTFGNVAQRYSDKTHIDKMQLHTIWAENTYTLTASRATTDTNAKFDNNNGWSGTSGTTRTKTVTYYEEFGSLPEVSRKGYTWLRWDARITTKAEVTATSSLYALNWADNLTIEAVWEPIKYYVSYNKNHSDSSGSSGSMSQKEGHTYDISFNLTNAFTRQHYEFSSWNTKADGTGTSYGVGESVENLTTTSGEIVTLYAQWTIKTYTLTAHADGGKISIPTPTGWTSGGGGTSTHNMAYGDTYSIPNELRASSRDGYTFLGWSLTRGETDITNRIARVTMSTSNLTIYAIWQPNTYTLTTDAGSGGKITGTSSQTKTYRVTYNGKYPTLTDATKDYYTFVGWFTSADGGTQVKAGDTVTTAENHTLYAHWTKIEYTVQCDANGTNANIDANEDWWTGSGTTVTLKGTLEINDSGKFNLSSMEVAFPITDGTSPEVHRTGYSCTGWWTRSSGGLEVTQEKLEFSPSELRISGTIITFYAHWTPITYYIKYEKNAPSGVTVKGSMANSEHTYDVQQQLTANAYTTDDYTFIGWSTTSDGAVKYEDEAKVKNLTAEDGAIVPLYAIWTEIYTINLYYNGDEGDLGGIAGYKLDAQDHGYPTYTYDDTTKNAVIEYITGNSFDLPNKDHVGRRGYTFNGWKRSGYTNIYTRVTSGMAYSFDLDAQWTKKLYTVKYFDGDELVDWLLYIDYDSEQTFPKLDRAGDHKFVGWTAIYEFDNDMYFDETNKILNYAILDEKVCSETIVGSEYETFRYDGSAWVDDVQGNVKGESASGAAWCNLIWKEGTKFCELLDSNSDTVTFYAVWTPIYTVTINAGDSNAVVNGDGKVEIDYFTKYELQKELSAIEDNSGTADRVYWKYHNVTGWQVKVGDTKYKISEKGEWVPLKSTDTDLVDVGVNLQYLQGNIEITPDWDPFKFNVIFKTAGSEDYKESYTDTYKTHDVIYGNDYIFVPHDAEYPAATKTCVKTTIINGYSLIYACPYKENGSIDINNKLRMYGTWDYDLDYKHNGSGYYIEVEGYYLPNLYKLKFNINEPYGTPTTETLTSDIASTALNVIKPLNVNTEDWTYSVNNDYNDKPGKLYKDSSNNYYIYLLNDSEMTYDSGLKRSVTHYATYNYTYSSNTHALTHLSWTLPTWTIPYYEMQYFYIIKQNNVNDITMYQMANVEGAHTEIAEEKIGGTHRQINPGNWTYKYCNSNNANGEGYTINLYWYRKRINLAVSNLFDGANSPNGYTVVQETEQITTSEGLQGHSPYHVVIYINDGVSNKYYIKAYSDEPTTNIKTELFDGENISVEILEAKGWAPTNSIEIYFGNKFTLMARDQRGDHSLNDFIGYRFKDFTLDEIFQTSATFGYRVYQNLQEIDKDTHQDGVTQYIEDRATYNVATNFEKIAYTITYQISNEELTYTSKYGHIRLQGKDRNNNTIDISSSNPAETKATLQVYGKMKSTMNVRLGSELLYWRSNSKADSLGGEQTYNLELTPEFLQDHIYYAEKDPYAVDDEELTIHAICQDILFDINVNVKDMETGKVIRTYTLSEETENLLFTIKDGLTKVSIDQAYDITMLSKRGGDSYVYYYQDIDGDDADRQYAVLRLYIEHSSSHSTEQLVTKFSYPTDSLGSIAMAVNHSLLDYTINYSQFVEVKDVNRHLDFYIEVSPTIEISFENQYDDRDAKIGTRKLTIMGQEVVSSSGDGDLEIKGSYLGYVGQTVTFNATADATYYKEVELLIDSNSKNMPLSADTSYKITQECTIDVMFIPKTYTYSIDCKYNQTLYENCREIDAVTGEEKWATIALADGTKIFYEINVAAVDGNKGTTPNYYYDDKLEVTAKLSTDITGFELNVYKNGIKLTGNNGVYTATFTGDETTKILVEVIPQPENVVIKTNPDKEGVADVHVKINNGEIKPLADYVSGIDLIDGDGLTVYVKSKLGYIFNNKYIKDDTTTDLTVKESEDMSGYMEFQLFTSYQATGVKGSKGTYFLQFDEVPIVAEFVYYSTTDEDVADAGKNTAVAQISTDPSYTETQVATFMPGAELKIINRVDNPGYRFLGYTYKQPMEVDDAVKLDSTFTISEDIYDYLSIDYPASIADGKVSFKIYVNYINQYKITVKTNSVSKTKIDLKTKIEEDEQPLSQNTYYDHGTLVIATLSTGRSKANDVEYYKFNVKINEVGITETSSGVTGVLKTNIGSLSGFTLTQDLVENMVIDITVTPEKYYTNLNEHLQYSDKTEDKSSSLEDITELNLTSNVYYKVESEHYYGNNVKIYIYTAKPKNVGEWYYELDKIELNGVSHKFGQAVSEYIENVEFYKYEITYTLNSDCVPEPTLDIYYKAYYYVEVNIVVNVGE